VTIQGVKMKISIFNRVTSKVPLELDVDFNGLVELFEDAASKTTPTKEDNELWSPGVYLNVKHRGKNNVSFTDVIGLDSDAFGTNIFNVMYELQSTNINYIVYTSYSHTDQHHKFRVVLPLSSKITNATDYKSVFDACNRWLKNVAPSGFDAQCCDISRIFYFPTINPHNGTCDVYYNKNNNNLDWELLLNTFPPPSPILLPPAKKALDNIRRGLLTKVVGKKIYHNNLLDSTLVRSDWLIKYYSTQKGQHYTEFYRLLCRIASRALQYNYPLDVNELSNIASDIDKNDSAGPHLDYNYLDQAKKAIAFAERIANDLSKGAA
jgi:hypothetical protein